MTAKPIVITQGEHAVSAQEDAVISTLLGSCVACCLHDPVARVGGMNHILIPNASYSTARFDPEGLNAMELLINDMLKLGAQKSRMEAKVFGGAKMVSGLSDIGNANARFVLDFLEIENIPCLSRSIGGETARHLVFLPTSGIARQKTKPRTTVPDVVPVAARTSPAQDVELF
ncbi:Chemoreceptor glutamine deamidase CheD [Sulfitobacter sp. THAF37]|uniref:chemotaxis protein CheD n=1 Tax=Sulfitobacter sp. THAF37 TaxID=2587855 RepID=UPI0012692771|nr:chemotaxis protein CheD [Sulfitobacter sp. THAF37]QFT59958.1 Chemoreceptor glutamine deamidase CheD [Sulfitobacter sp. THAF37]